ncbi:MAG: hypothetical protein OEX22_08625 [Cyclobacteriaceae bacterium]|nr:hypothetical protein [Cyclobacteriaceae bacterium]
MLKKLNIFSSIAILIAMMIYASGCDFCDGTSQEPLIEIIYQGGGAISSVYAVKAGESLPPITGASGSNFNIPIDVNETSVTYNFETTQGNKSMQIYYDPITNLESFECGFRFAIDNLRIGSTTFNSASITGGGDFSVDYQITIQ